MPHSTRCSTLPSSTHCILAGALRDPCFEAGKARISTLSDQLQAKGVYGCARGRFAAVQSCVIAQCVHSMCSAVSSCPAVLVVCRNNALQLLQKYSNQINWQVRCCADLTRTALLQWQPLCRSFTCAFSLQGMSQDVFSSFYRFVYFICREPGKRNVQVRIACCPSGDPCWPGQPSRLDHTQCACKGAVMWTRNAAVTHLRTCVRRACNCSWNPGMHAHLTATMVPANTAESAAKLCSALLR